MAQAPLVSVLMPVYNGEKYLREAIDSILAQTFTDFEFIIINDGSADHSESIILSYTDPRIRYIRNEKNLRLIATLNKGLEHCRGKYIARMDADDIAYPERFRIQVEFMEAHPEFGLCGTNIDVDGRIKSWVQIGESEYIRFSLLFHNPFCHPTTFIRTAVLREHQLCYPAEYVHAEEYKLWVHILRFAPVFNLSEKLLMYRMHENQVSTIFRNDQIKMVERIRLELFSEIVRFSTPAARKAHLAIAARAVEQLQLHPLDEISLDFGSEVTRLELQRWVWLMKYSLRFKNSWDSKYLRTLINKVQAASRSKKWELLRPVRQLARRVLNKSKRIFGMST